MMFMSDKGKALLIEWEGSKPKMYLDSAGLPTIGVGHLLSKSELTSGKISILNFAVKYSNGLTARQVMDLLSMDLIPVEYIINKNVDSKLAQNQFDALCSFAFNTGTHAFLNSTLLKRINEGKLSDVPLQLRRWTIAGGRVIPGLVARRENEIKLWQGVI